MGKFYNSLRWVKRLGSILKNSPLEIFDSSLDRYRLHFAAEWRRLRRECTIISITAIFSRVLFSTTTKFFSSLPFFQPPLKHGTRKSRPRFFFLVVKTTLSDSSTIMIMKSINEGFNWRINVNKHFWYSVPYFALNSYWPYPFLPSPPPHQKKYSKSVRPPPPYLYEQPPSKL